MALQAELSKTHSAVINNDIAQLRRLQRGGELELDARTHEGRTPLHLAFQSCQFNSHYEVIHFLLKAGSDIKARDNMGETPVFLLNFGSDRVNNDLTFSLIRAKINLLDTNSSNETLLFNAIRSSRLHIVNLCLNNSVPLNAQNTMGRTPLHVACSVGNRGIIEKLIDLKVNVQIIDNQLQLPIEELVNSNPITYDRLLVLLFSVYHFNTLNSLGIIF